MRGSIGTARDNQPRITTAEKIKTNYRFSKKVKLVIITLAVRSIQGGSSSSSPFFPN